MKVGDIVGRVSYNKDIIFVISQIKGNTAYLQGLYVRLLADSDVSDLVLIDEVSLSRYKESKREYEERLISSFSFL